MRDSFCRRALALGSALALCVLSVSSATAEDWKPAAGPLMTKWATEVSPNRVLTDYPRPQLCRPDWQNLNKLWDYAIRPKAGMEPPQEWDGKILVPFAIESALSGVMKNVGPDKRLWYRTTFELPQHYRARRVMLNFGAVDWAANVRVNGTVVGNHTGGFDPFSCEITTALKQGDTQELIVSVYDPSDASHQPRGKQIRNPHGIWYTPVTGIWQTVWIEPVGLSYVSRLKLTPDVDASSINIQVLAGGGSLADGPTENFKASVLVGGKVVASGEGNAKGVTIKIPEPRLWSPDDPFLYDLKVELGNDEVVTSYFGLRKINVAKDDAGFNRLCLNNKPLFHLGPLDQGWWPDGLYTAPTDDALRYDIEMTKKLGFNMCRKHVKVEPERWYYWCDKLGLLVWQDMPSGDRYIGPNDPDYERSEAAEKTYRDEWKAIMAANHNHPSIVVWVPFNEGWGQFKTNEILKWTKELDPSRLVDGPSGWSDRGEGDMHDAHIYPGPGMPKVEEKRAVVLGEFGGLGLPLENHVWVNDKKNWGYRNFSDKESLTKAYKNLYYGMQSLYADGLAAAVYTQTTDVEIEVNGLMTYDRAVLKIDAEEIAALHRTFYDKPLKFETILADSRQNGRKWKYTIEKPADGWEKPGFDDAMWNSGEGGFGTAMTPGTKVRTEWKTDDIWARQEFEIADPKVPMENLQLTIHHDEDTEIYINGQEVAAVTGFTTDYVTVPLDAKNLKLNSTGKNVIAIHCHQTGGGQYIDVGIVGTKPKSAEPTVPPRDK